MQTFKITVTTTREVEVLVDETIWTEEYMEMQNKSHYPVTSLEEVAKEAAIQDAVWENQMPGVTVKLEDDETTSVIKQ